MKDKQQQKGSKSVLDDKEKFERSQSDQKLQHMGDKPRKPAAGSKAPPGQSEK
jgi:hypothetical protein